MPDLKDARYCSRKLQKLLSQANTSVAVSYFVHNGAAQVKAARAVGPRLCHLVCGNQGPGLGHLN